jgi:MFS family permease
MLGLLREGSVLAFWLANLFSNLGTGAFILALNWLAVKRHGALGIGALALAYGVPQFALQLFGGSASDRLDRRRLFLATETGFMLVALALLMACTHNLAPLWVLVATNFLFGAISAFDTPARTALISQMVRPGEVVLAQQFFALSTSAAGVLGPALGGVLLSIGSSDRSHEEVAFLFNVLSYIPLLLIVPWLSIAATDTGPRPSGSLLEGVREGVAYVRAQATLRSLFLLLAIVMLLGMPFQTLLPIFVRSHLALQMGHGFYAALLSAVGLGAFCGSLLGVFHRQSRVGPLLLAASLGLGLSILLLIGSQVVHWASLAAFLGGVFGSLAINMDAAMIQGCSPPAMRGRVAGIANLTKGMQAFSAAAATVAIHRLGYLDVQLTLALLLLLGVLLLYPWLRRTLGEGA